MEPKFQTSFIPKKPIVSNQLSGTVVVRDANILSIIGTTIFIVTTLVYASLWGYQFLLKSQIEKADLDINKARETFELDNVQVLIRENDRIMASNNLLKKHVMVSRLFGLLEEITVKKIRFSSFKYTSSGNTPTLTMTAEAQSYNALTAQSEIFAKNEFMKNPQFLDFVTGENGHVTANFSSSIDPLLMSYKQVVESASASTVPTEQTQTVTGGPEVGS